MREEQPTIERPSIDIESQKIKNTHTQDLGR